MFVTEGNGLFQTALLVNSTYEEICSTMMLTDTFAHGLSLSLLKYQIDMHLFFSALNFTFHIDYM